MRRLVKIVKNTFYTLPKTLFLMLLGYLSVNYAPTKAQDIEMDLVHNLEENNDEKNVVNYSKPHSITNSHLIWKVFLALSIVLLSNVYVAKSYAGFWDTLKSIVSLDPKYEGDTSGYYNMSLELEKQDRCSLESLKKQYIENPDTNCWYCNIVSTMTGAYLEAVANMMNIVETLALLILRYGFMIWLAYYILQQVSSLAPITPGKMLQEILMMGFKVLLATLAVRQGISLLTEYFLDPVMLFGIDYGQTMLNGMMGNEILGSNATPSPGTFGGGSFGGHGATSRW